MLLYLCNVYSALLIDSCSCNGQGMRAPCDSEARREWRLRKWKSDDAGVCYVVACLELEISFRR